MKLDLDELDDQLLEDLDDNDAWDNDGEYPDVGESLISQGKKLKKTLKEIKSTKPSVLLKLISRAKNFLKKDKIWKKICKEYNEDPEIIDLIPTTFADLDVSANTNHGVVYINYKLLQDGEFFRDYSYLIHEYTHWFQQCYGDRPTMASEEGRYLYNPHEQEGFQNQLEYISHHFGEDKAESYVDHLLEYHDVKGKKKQDKLESVLLEKVK